MNSAVNYYSAAQRHADAVRESRRNPPLRAVPDREPTVRRTLFSRIALRSTLGPGWSRA